jgi:hypothetical protein
MSETIKSIEEYNGKRPSGYGTEAGYLIATDEQEIVLAIDDDQCCCETWGYFLSEDDPQKFIGATLTGLSLTDTALVTKDIPMYDGKISLDSGDTLFVNLDTDRGRLQFVAYNAHNGYYGHEARIESRQLQHEVVL